MSESSRAVCFKVVEYGMAFNDITQGFRACLFLSRSVRCKVEWECSPEMSIPDDERRSLKGDYIDETCLRFAVPYLMAPSVGQISYGKS